MKNIIQRTLSGILYLAIIIGSLFLGKFAFGIVFLLICLFALYEFYGLARASGDFPFTVPSIFAGTFLFIISFMVSDLWIPPLFLLLMLPLVIFIFTVALFSNRREVFRSTAISLLGILYIAVPLSTINFLAFPPSNNYEYTHRVLLGILTLVWINDTGAYVVGISLGRHRLMERISPKKSWEGAMGGAVFTFLAAWWMAHLMGLSDRPDWMVIALIVSIFGVLGDLTESLFKRRAGVKDSGSIIPGHGGILDRIDSILFVMPLSLVYLLFSKLLTR